MNEGPDEYDPAWDELRLRRKWAFRPFVLGIATGAIAAFLRLFLDERHWVIALLAMLFVVSLPFSFVGLLRLGVWKCPRCSQRFHDRPRLGRWGDECGHCGLHEFEAKEWRRVNLDRN